MLQGGIFIQETLGRRIVLLRRREKKKKKNLQMILLGINVSEISHNVYTFSIHIETQKHSHEKFLIFRVDPGFVWAESLYHLGDSI